MVRAPRLGDAVVTANSRREIDMLKLFRLRTEDRPTMAAGPASTEMRGRAAEIADPAGLEWDVLWEALKTQPPDDDSLVLTQELGLDEERSIRSGFERALPATEFSGTRDGRSVALRIGIVPTARGKGMNEVQIETSVAPFRIEAKDGRLVAGAGAMPEVEAMLGELVPDARIWRELVVEAGPDGIRARRPVTAHPQGYVYDLWLVERLADRLGA
jgi:hypothetical protein